jgi:hypothetical protein
LFGYLYGFESLIKVTSTGPTFHHDIASEDARFLIEDLKAGKCNIEDLAAYLKVYVRTIGILKQLHREGRSEWTSNAYQAAWANGKFPDGRRIN